MNIDEVISKAEMFAMNFIAKISDKTEQAARKQSYFLDNQDQLKKYMNALQKIVNSVDTEEDSEEESDDAVLVMRANDIISKLKTAISEYQKELTIDNDITEQDTTATLTQETISDAMETNKTTQEISANMNAIAKQQSIASQIGYNYALVCDGQIHMIAATDKTQLNTSINAIANEGSYKSIQLFEMKFTPIKLNKKTVLSV